ncbi:MAG: DNA mismatch repair protein MutT [Elusimicrobia bacterium CG11_big_fil_rev_8_21_14_0_20_64_6]|nr:MAG: DNA mismatch repair protein MutT [Elusimicrobia bacterium CG11_big_fil_rev_8_21_14_0_20_64_6]
MKTVAATLCYVRDGGRTLMLHRNKKDGDVHKGKWNGLGGKFNAGESPEECVVREIREESGLTLLDARLRGVLTFPAFKNGEDWLVFVYTATRFEGDLIPCAEGDLEWVEDSRLTGLPLWEGDLIFLPWLDQERFFSGKFVYRDGRLVSHEVSFSGEGSAQVAS